MTSLPIIPLIESTRMVLLLGSGSMKLVKSNGSAILGSHSTSSKRASTSSTLVPLALFRIRTSMLMGKSTQVKNSN